MRSGGRQDSNVGALGVTIEAQYTVGEYDILILSAKESFRAGNLAHPEWLQDSCWGESRYRQLPHQGDEIFRGQGESQGTR